jgi:hypothetical protein
MKTLILILCFPLISSAADKAYQYEWHYKHAAVTDDLKYRITNLSRDVAFETAVEFCMNFYSRNAHLTKDQQVDLIDVCANPIDKN